MRFGINVPLYSRSAGADEMAIDIISPQGEEIHVTNLAKWVRENPQHDLNYDSVYAAFHDGRTVKGWSKKSGQKKPESTAEEIAARDRAMNIMLGLPV